DDTVPARRSITVEDLLTCRFGFGSIMAQPGIYPIQDAEAELELQTLGWPWPPKPLTSDEWIARFATLPLLEQPGEAWRYHTGIQILGIYLERLSGQSLEEFLRVRIFEPLGMAATSFSLPPGAKGRLTPAYLPDDESEGLQVFDEPETSLWTNPPLMANAAGGLLSTIDDLWAFVSMILADGKGVLKPESVAAMTRNHLTATQRASAPMFLGEHGGWGYGMAAPGPVTGDPPKPWGFGWGGGTGTEWRSDPVRGLTGILLTQRGVNSPAPPRHYSEFWSAAYDALPS
ncbi:MAG: serine hydrolase domain-containing protein, partial [Thermomicrobiales bacterium]